MTDETVKLYTKSEVAEILRVPISTISYWRAQGQGPRFLHVGKRIVCRKDDLEAFIDTLASAPHPIQNEKKETHA